MTVYDDMRGYIHTHDRNGWFDVTTETTPMYQMVDKAEAENAKLRELCTDFAAMLTLAGLDGLSVEATIGGTTKTYDASELCDKVEEIWDKED